MECMDSVQQPVVESQLSADDYAEPSTDALTEALASEDSRRLALYVPFERLHDAVQNGETELVQTYKSTWKSLLHVRDVAANFTDGDVPEVAYRDGDLPRIVKARQLLSHLVRVGVLEADGPDAQRAMQTETVHEGHIAPAGQTYPVSANRQRWLDERQAEQQFGRVVARVAQKILHGSSIIENEPQTAHYEGVYEAIRRTAISDHVMAKQLYAVYANQLEAGWQSASADQAVAMTRIYRRLNSLKIVDDEQLAGKGIAASNLAGSSMEQLPSMAKDLRLLEGMTRRIAADPAVADYDYSIGPVDVLIIEGDLPRNDYDLRLYLHMPDEQRLQNNIQRESEHDDHAQSGTLTQRFNDRQRTLHKPYTLPALESADYAITTNCVGDKWRFSIYQKAER